MILKYMKWLTWNHPPVGGDGRDGECSYWGHRHRHQDNKPGQHWGDKIKVVTRTMIPIVTSLFGLHPVPCFCEFLHPINGKMFYTIYLQDLFFFFLSTLMPLLWTFSLFLLLQLIAAGHILRYFNTFYNLFYGLVCGVLANICELLIVITEYRKRRGMGVRCRFKPIYKIHLWSELITNFG